MPKYGTQCKRRSLKYGAKFEQKCWQMMPSCCWVCHGRFHCILPKEHSGTFYALPLGLYKGMSTSTQGQQDIVTHKFRVGATFRNENNSLWNVFIQWCFLLGMTGLNTQRKFLGREQDSRERERERERVAANRSGINLAIGENIYDGYRRIILDH